MAASRPADWAFVYRRSQSDGPGVELLNLVQHPRFGHGRRLVSKRGRLHKRKAVTAYPGHAPQ